MIEQRKHQRFDLKLPLAVVRGGANHPPSGETRNVSSSGVLFTSPVPMEIGEPIEYLITFPRVPGSKSEVRLRCMGTILRGDEQETFAATLERYEFVRARA
jgi:hypothetical protein